MLLIGLTGGMGAGKSTVARMLRERGAVVIDADAIAREVVEPGEPALARIAARFGEGVLDGDRLDRGALAEVVFDDARALADLEAITHPTIAARVERRIADHRDTDRVVVLDHPLLVEQGRHAEVDVVVVVEAPVELRIERLAERRGVDEDDARARIARQTDDASRRAVADHVVVNDADQATLEQRVSRLWTTLTG